MGFFKMVPPGVDAIILSNLGLNEWIQLQRLTKDDQKFFKENTALRIALNQKIRAKYPDLDEEVVNFFLEPTTFTLDKLKENIENAIEPMEEAKYIPVILKDAINCNHQYFLDHCYQLIAAELKPENRVFFPDCDILERGEIFWALVCRQNDVVKRLLGSKGNQEICKIENLSPMVISFNTVNVELMMWLYMKCNQPLPALLTPIIEHARLVDLLRLYNAKKYEWIDKDVEIDLKTRMRINTPITDERRKLQRVSIDAFEERFKKSFSQKELVELRNNKELLKVWFEFKRNWLYSYSKKPSEIEQFLSDYMLLSQGQNQDAVKNFLSTFIDYCLRSWDLWEGEINTISKFCEHNEFREIIQKRYIDGAIFKIDNAYFYRLNAIGYKDDNFIYKIYSLLEDGSYAQKYLLSLWLSQKYKLYLRRPDEFEPFSNSLRWLRKQWPTVTDSPLNSIYNCTAMDWLFMVNYWVQQNKELVEAKSEKGFNPLLIAALYGHTAIVKYLLKQGANWEVIVDKLDSPFFGKTPLDLAKDGRTKVQAGKTALDLAKAQVKIEQYTQIISLLEQKKIAVSQEPSAKRHKISEISEEEQNDEGTSQTMTL